MKYLKLFDTESDYLAYRYDRSNYIKPNISLCEGNGSAYYNYPPLNPNFNGYTYVDLGLPSNTLWAAMNVGASKPSDGGLYFQWGDTSGYTADQVGTGNGQKRFHWGDYKWSINGSTYNFSKYTTPGATLELEDDAAHVNMGGDWHMPTPAQIQELLDNTTTAWTAQDEVSGMTFTSKKDSSKAIFIPAVGGAMFYSMNGSGSQGYVWSCVKLTYDNSNAQYLNFDSGRARLHATGRVCGLSIRGVIG